MRHDDGPTLLIVNTGSSSVKLTIWGSGKALHSVKLGRHDTTDLAAVTAPFGSIAAVVHRVVHAGDVQRHTPITPTVERAIHEATPLAPLHNPMALRYIALAREAFGPAMIQLAALDTAFFAELPAHAACYALPAEVGPARRYGFHGLAHAFMTRRTLELDGRAPRRLVTLQLGAGCSATAIKDGRPLDTSMGFSPSEGLMMASRAGDVDPGLLIHLMRTRGYSADQLDEVLNERGGLLGMCGHGDMPEVLQRASGHDARAMLALDLYCHRVRKVIGAYAAVLGGIDCIVFGGGVGENAVEVRRRIIEPLAWLGVDLDVGKNASNPADEAITTQSSWTVAWVIRMDEAAQMARIAADLLRSV